MLIIQLIWQEVYKLCQFKCGLDRSVMVTHLYLGVTFFVTVFATAVANAGILGVILYILSLIFQVFQKLKLVS